MLHLIYKFADTQSDERTLQVTDGFPQVSGRTLLAALVLTLAIAFGSHAVFKYLVVKSVIEPALAAMRVGKETADLSVLTSDAARDAEVAWSIVNAPLYAKAPPLTRRLENAQGPATAADEESRAASRESKRVGWLPEFFATYFSPDISAVQIYLKFLPQCTDGKDLDKQRRCDEMLLNDAYVIAGDIKHDGVFILYRLQAGYIQLAALYIFSVGVLIGYLRMRRAGEIVYYAAEGERFAERFMDWDKTINSLSFKTFMREYWQQKVTDDPDFPGLAEHLAQFGTILYEPGSDVERLARMQERAGWLRRFHAALSLVVSHRANREMSWFDRHAEVLPRVILRVINAFVIDQPHFPVVGRARANAALEHSVDELGATLTVDRDLYSRCVELVPVIGFFGTVWGLSLAMLGANDVIRAQEANWFYDIAGGASFITESFKNHQSEEQQLALEGMLGALSIKFDTTGYALILMFSLIVFGAFANRREDRALSALHSTVSETTLSVLPTFGGFVVPIQQVELKPLQVPTTPPPSPEAGGNVGGAG